MLTQSRRSLNRRTSPPSLSTIRFVAPRCPNIYATILATSSTDPDEPARTILSTRDAKLYVNFGLYAVCKIKSQIFEKALGIGERTSAFLFPILTFGIVPSPIVSSPPDGSTDRKKPSCKLWRLPWSISSCIFFNTLSSSLATEDEVPCSGTSHLALALARPIALAMVEVDGTVSGTTRTVDFLFLGFSGD